MHKESLAVVAVSIGNDGKRFVVHRLCGALLRPFHILFEDVVS